MQEQMAFADSCRHFLVGKRMKQEPVAIQLLAKTTVPTKMQGGRWNEKITSASPFLFFSSSKKPKDTRKYKKDDT